MSTYVRPSRAIYFKPETDAKLERLRPVYTERFRARKTVLRSEVVAQANAAAFALEFPEDRLDCDRAVCSWNEVEP